ncbi:MAG: hypothetical protein K0S44_1521 [Bacteroidetes bacterium]|jgi:hypothetical protein|nr:hypothetical protein [Bacteroidota bacterium]
MKYIFLSLFMTTVMNFSANSQINLQWANSIGGANEERIYSVAVDDSQNVYSTGHFRGTVDFDPGVNVFNLTSSSSTIDVFITKFDGGGNLIWAKRIEGTSSYGIALDAANNVYVTGYFNGTGDFDPGPGIFNLTSGAPSAMFICELNSNGNFVVAKKMGERAIGKSLDFDNQGNVFVTGFYEGISDFDPTTSVNNLVSAGNKDVFICKYDEMLNLVWAKSMGSSSSFGDFSNSISVDSFGAVLITGMFSGEMDFDPDSAVFTMTANGSYDMYVAKFSSSGGLIWAKQMGGGLQEEASSIKTDSLGNSYITGYHRGLADFDPSNNIYNLYSDSNEVSIFVIKLDSLGALTWAKGFTGPGFGFGNALSIDNALNVYITGYFSDTLDFDPNAGTFNLATTGSFDMFLCKLDNSGNLDWVKDFKALSGALPNAMAIDLHNNIILAGDFDNVVDFDCGPNTFNLSPVGQVDAFVIKLKPTVAGVGQMFTDIQIDVYPNPNNGMFAVWLKNLPISDSKIDFLDITGKLLMTINRELGPESEEISFDCSLFENGLYFLRIYSQSHYITHKILINK